MVAHKNLMELHFHGTFELPPGGHISYYILFHIRVQIRIGIKLKTQIIER
jgi:hypothetical protein